MPSIFHQPAISLAVAAQAKSRASYPLPSYDIVRDAYFVLTHDAVCVHRAIAALVDAGWSGPGGALLRTLMDISVSAVAINQSASPKLAAFRYLYSGLRRHARDSGQPPEARRATFAEIRKRLQLLTPEDRAAATDVLREKDRPYWFAPEWKSPSEVLTLFAGNDLSWTYMQLSGAAHGTFLGMRLYRDGPDEIGINPRAVGRRAMSLELASCRWLIEILRIRSASEGLGLEPDIDKLAAEIAEAAARLPPAAT